MVSPPPQLATPFDKPTMSFHSLTVSTDKEASYAPPPHYLYSIRHAVLLPGSGPAHLYLRTENYDGTEVEAFVGTLEAKPLASSRLSLDLAFGFSTKVTLIVKSAATPAQSASVSFLGFVHPTKAVLDSPYDSSEEEGEEEGDSDDEDEYNDEDDDDDEEEDDGDDEDDDEEEQDEDDEGEALMQSNKTSSSKNTNLVDPDLDEEVSEIVGLKPFSQKGKNVGLGSVRVCARCEFKKFFSYIHLGFYLSYKDKHKKTYQQRNQQTFWIYFF